LKRGRGADGQDTADVTEEEILDQTSNQYEAIVAMAKEARRLNAVPGVFLGKEERAIPRAVENFVGGRVEYVVEGEACGDGARGGARKKAGRKASGKTAGKAVNKTVKKAAKKAARKGAKKSSRKK